MALKEKIKFEGSELYNCVRYTNDESLLRFLEQSKIASKEQPSQFWKDAVCLWKIWRRKGGWYE